MTLSLLLIGGRFPHHHCGQRCTAHLAGELLWHLPGQHHRQCGPAAFDNTIPVKLQQIITPQTSFNFLKNQLGISTLVENRTENGRVLSDINLAPMALGEMTDGVTPLAMAGADQIFGNGGVDTEPYSYTRVETADGTVILEHTPLSKRVISSESATVLNHLLQGVTTGHLAPVPLPSSAPCPLPVKPVLRITTTTSGSSV